VANHLLEFITDNFSVAAIKRFRGNAAMANVDEYKELTEYLRSEGHTEAEIEKILARVRKYEFETLHDSVMDSIGGGTFDLAALIKEALAEEN
jgi:hypothetical protein